MAVKHTWTQPELMELADRMISRGTSVVMNDQKQLQRDCLACGRIVD
jgi:hypothetical protein